MYGVWALAQGCLGADWALAGSGCALAGCWNGAGWALAGLWLGAGCMLAERLERVCETLQARTHAAAPFGASTLSTLGRNTSALIALTAAARGIAAAGRSATFLAAFATLPATLPA